MAALAYAAAETSANNRAEKINTHKPCVYWYLSLRCNLTCKHCWVNSSPATDTSHDLTTIEALMAVGKLKELNPLNVLLSGGEVFFRTDVYAILEAMISQRVHFGIESNGILVSPSLVRILRTAVDQQLQTGICISVDGGTPELHNWLRGPRAFERTMRGISLLRDAGIHVTIQCIVNQRNVETISGLFQIASQYSLRSVQIGFVNPVGRGADYYDELGLEYDQYDRAMSIIASEGSSFGGEVVLKAPPAIISPSLLPRISRMQNLKLSTSCMFPLLGILPDGTVTICALTRDMEQVRFGNIRTDSLVEIWRREEIGQLRDAYENASLTGICGDCVFRRGCKGSCRAHAFTEFGSFQEPYPLCTAYERDGRFPSLYRESWRSRYVITPR